MVPNTRLELPGPMSSAAAEAHRERVLALADFIAGVEGASKRVQYWTDVYETEKCLCLKAENVKAPAGRRNQA